MDSLSVLLVETQYGPEDYVFCSNEISREMHFVVRGTALCTRCVHVNVLSMPHFLFVPDIIATDRLLVSHNLDFKI